jgi:4-alpha-glucanotransferase
MPIGAASNGAEVWENPSAYVLDTGIGAPADPMRPRGQSWGFTPYHPFVLKEQKYKPFINLARENMKNSGALRIDHAMGLLRLFWGFFEEGNPVVQGAYIYYDMKVLTAILSVESNRAKCLIIGEDLGTVPEGFREYMAEHGLLSYKVFFRQKEKDGSFIEPKEYQYMSLAQSSTHDQATSVGFWANEDIEVFKQCGLYVNNEQYLANLEGRKSDRFNMIKAFEKEGILNEVMKISMEQTAENGCMVPQGIENVVNIFGAKTNSAIYLVRLCDVFAQKVLDNAPGTIDEYTNWRIKLRLGVDEIKDSLEFANVMGDIRKYRS